MFGEQVNDWTDLLEAVEGSSGEITISAKNCDSQRVRGKHHVRFSWLRGFPLAQCMTQGFSTEGVNTLNLSVLAWAQEWSCSNCSCPETPAMYLYLPCSPAPKKSTGIFFSVFRILLSKFVQIFTLLLLLSINLHTQQCLREYFTHSHVVIPNNRKEEHVVLNVRLVS